MVLFFIASYVHLRIPASVLPSCDWPKGPIRVILDKKNSYDAQVHRNYHAKGFKEQQKEFIEQAVSLAPYNPALRSIAMFTVTLEKRTDPSLNRCMVNNKWSIGSSLGVPLSLVFCSFCMVMQLNFTTIHSEHKGLLPQRKVQQTHLAYGLPCYPTCCGLERWQNIYLLLKLMVPDSLLSIAWQISLGCIFYGTATQASNFAKPRMDL